ncbi:enoyl-CoA hydratase/isomerase family protein [Bernardetia sp.]|uniref:enoyl-CoA hydratase/isomerase family protein n=1 Tax=Bernardetia sp. TaxID=1937974 RepID=UPI0025BAA848|nr:enoyl-CoA hydratase/isomerase family protein [Bernardetia sp.]
MTTVQTNFETLTVTTKENIVTLQLNRGKANPINRQMISDLHNFFEQATQDEEVSGVIMTGKEHFFSSGLDLKQLYAMNEEEVREFWIAFMKMTKVVASFPKPLVAAITGHSPAGGCVLAVCADYRIMAEGEKYLIGLNEIPVGIVVPKVIFDLYAFWIGNKTAYQYLLEGKLMTPSDAKRIGLVDEVVSADKVLKQAEEKMEDYTNFDGETWSISKANLRGGMLEGMNFDNLDEILEPMLKQWWSPRTRSILKMIIASLSSK